MSLTNLFLSSVVFKRRPSALISISGIKRNIGSQVWRVGRLEEYSHWFFTDALSWCNYELSHHNSGHFFRMVSGNHCKTPWLLYYYGWLLQIKANIGSPQHHCNRKTNNHYLHNRSKLSCSFGLGDHLSILCKS